VIHWIFGNFNRLAATKMRTEYKNMIGILRANTPYPIKAPDAPCKKTRPREPMKIEITSAEDIDDSAISNNETGGKIDPKPRPNTNPYRTVDCFSWNRGKFKIIVLISCSNKGNKVIIKRGCKKRLFSIIALKNPLIIPITNIKKTVFS